MTEDSRLTSFLKKVKNIRQCELSATTGHFTSFASSCGATDQNQTTQASWLPFKLQLHWIWDRSRGVQESFLPFPHA